MQKLTKEQALAVTGFTGVLAMDFDEFHQDLEKRLGRPVWTHEMASKELWEGDIKSAYKADFLSMCPGEEA